MTIFSSISSPLCTGQIDGRSLSEGDVGSRRSSLRRLHASGGFALVLTLAVGSGCATTSKTTSGESEGDTMARPNVPAPVDPSTVTIAPMTFDANNFAFIDGTSGAALSFDDVKARVQKADAVLVGEQHNLASHHLLQAEIIRAVGVDGTSFAVALEMVANNHALALDRFTRGEIDAEGLRAATNWDKEWGHIFEIYVPILDATKETNAKLFGVNAPRTLVRALAKRGIEGLTDAERAQLPELDMGDTVHRNGIKEFFEQHHPAIDRHKAFESFYRVQVLWDEAMADGSAKALKAAGKVVVIAGNGHIAGYRAIPNRLKRRAPEASTLTIIPITLDQEDDAMEVAKEAVAGREGDIIAIERAREVLAL